MLNDMNGDGSITRDEWLGSDAVFDALDKDHDGLISQEDVRQGFGAALAFGLAAGFCFATSIFSSSCGDMACRVPP